jgi:DinB superfamily
MGLDNEKSEMTKPEILQKLAEGFSIVDDTLRNADDAIFYVRKDNKWSIAENCKHLSLSVKPLNMAFLLPNFALLFFGKLDRPARTYDEMVSKYLQKLAEGAVATAQFVPEKLSVENKKEDLIEELKKINDSFLKKVDDFTEEDLDKYLIPHPVLGKLTIREMLYFTICHTLHHHKAILFQQN